MTMTVFQNDFPAGLRAIRAVNAQLAKRLESLFAESLPADVLLYRARRLILRFEPALQSVLRDSLLAGWLKGATKAGRKVKPLELSPLEAILPPPLPPPFGPAIGGLGAEPLIRFPVVERAARSLFSKGLFLADDFKQLDQDAMRTAFTVARVRSLEAIQKVKDALVQDIAQGGTLREFQADMRGVIDNALSDAQIETLYRTHVGRSYAQGMREVLRHPLVSDEFPFLMWSATHDSRVRATHLAMEKHGLNGGAIYWADDPMWDILTPPAEWNCRCNALPLSLEDAANNFGLRVAREWLRTGEEPVHVWAEKPYPIIPPPGWPTLPPGRIAAMAV